ncbi:lactonase family protein [Aliifodinibius salicampi]|uniref:Lactonase family protein n=1 Tax=Fodinibius salicampi TaxID=1920655 RepID=A0ABT3PVC6_9BACT|nr:lactonase family protein [Fodinibius salicampi]MCW9711798.1 lactonase family protein [Fodinibius salicampi]
MRKILCFAVMSMLLIFYPASILGQSSSFYLFVGTYTSGESEGIYVYEFNAETGEANYISKVSGVENPSYIAISPDDNYVYAVNETGAENGGSVSAFSFDKAKGELKFLNKKSSRGGHPCYVSVDQTGRWAFAGNYSGGSLSMLPIAEDGSLQEAKAYFEHSGSSVNKNRQERPHVHCTYVAPDNEHVLVADLGTDQVKSYRFNASKGELAPLESGVYEAEPGSGPRHITFHPEGDFAYLINELNGTIDAFTFEAGKLNKIQQVSTLPENYEGVVSGADIQLSPDGKFLYASNREDLNNIVIYSVNQENGQLSYVGKQNSGGIHPRNFMIDPTGQYLLVANRNTDNVVVFKRDKESGMLTKTGNEFEISMPVCLKMMSVD